MADGRRRRLPSVIYRTIDVELANRFSTKSETYTVSSSAVCVQPVSATPLAVYRLAFGSPRSFADVD